MIGNGAANPKISNAGYQEQVNDLNTIFVYNLKGIVKENTVNKQELRNVKNEWATINSNNSPIHNIAHIYKERSITDRKSEIYKLLLIVIYEMIKEFDQKFDFKSQKILTMKAYYEIEHLRNKFLCHSSLTRLSQLNLDLLNTIMMLVDSQYLLQNANKSDDYDGTHHILINVQEVIDNNILFMDFFHLNEDTA